MPYSFREALAAFRRTPLLTMLSVVAIGFSLFVVGLFGLTAYNIRRAIEQVEEKVEVVAYLNDDVQPQQVAVAEQEIRALPEVASIRSVSKTEAMATAMQTMEEFKDVSADLEANPFPASLEVKLKPGQRTPVAVARVAKHLGAYPFVEDVRYGREWLDKIFVLRQILGGAATIIGGAFALVAAIVIATAVRIAVFARREEISIMRLVGATDGFIRKPFLLEGLATGFAGGILSAVLTYAAFRVLDATMLRIEWLPGSYVLLVVATGTVFGLLSSAAAVRRHLRAV
ncbi:MAG TPA: permease-like cell division protein FtsX [Longimicrobiaceae bacterium]|nr:permease-like cell division protein FtsX [Longimicrobiaceae bacterium]